VHLPPLNWRRVSSSEDNSMLLILCISAGELNHLPALFTCHLSDAADVRQCEILQMKDSFRHRDANESLLGARPSFEDARVEYSHEA
jgi:hypothetical protein